MKIALHQLNPKIGAVDENLRMVLKALEESKKQGAELVLFPELTFLGYPPRDLLESLELVKRNEKAAETAGKQTQGLAAVFSVVEKNSAAGQKPVFNVAQVWQDGKCILKYRKKLFPYYDVFDEERHFQPGDQNGFFEVAGKKVAVTICEDAWGRQGFEWDYHGRDVIEDLKGSALDLLINLSASPFHFGKPERRELLFAQIAQELNCPVAYCDQAGVNDELIFDGASFILDAKGKLEARLPVFKESSVTHLLGQAGQISAYPATKEAWHFEALAFGIRDYVKKSGGEKLILGLSGGIDSCVVAAIAKEAVGNQNVKAVALPSKYNASASLSDSKQLAEKLGIDFQAVSIEPMVQAFLKSLPVTGLALENIQPRVRMTVLMAIANSENRILLNTSNKSEISCGYATLYGDTSGALAVLGDLKKHEVYALAKYINRNGEIIPQNAITRAPSAELRENQTDQDSLPAYDVLDEIVRLFIEEGKTFSEIKSLGVDPKAVDIFQRLYRSSEYKRRQLPPALRLTSKAFGMGRRIPVAADIV